MKQLRYKLDVETKKIIPDLDYYKKERKMTDTINLYAIKDKKVGFEHVFPMKTHGLAIRGFQELANDNKSNVSKYPEDFELYHIGTLDNQTGQLGQNLTCLAKGEEYAKKDNNPF